MRIPKRNLFEYCHFDKPILVPSSLRWIVPVSVLLPHFFTKGKIHLFTYRQQEFFPLPPPPRQSSTLLSVFIALLRSFQQLTGSPSPDVGSVFATKQLKCINLFLCTMLPNLVSQSNFQMIAVLCKAVKICIFGVFFFRFPVFVAECFFFSPPLFWQRCPWPTREASLGLAQSHIWNRPLRWEWKGLPCV